MDWIKKNYDKFILGLLALLLIGASVFLFLNTQKFADNFSDAAAAPSKSRKIPELDTSVIGSARQKLKSPNLWNSTNHSSLLFTSELYYLKDGQLKKPTDDSLYTHSRMAADPAGKIPNLWFLQNRLGLGAGIQFQDSDGDGFPNEDEWLFKTDPNAKESHPEYHALLFLNRWIKVRFRLKFQAYDGDPKTPEKMEFQINPLDAGARTEFVKIGEPIQNTKFKVAKFEFKESKNQSTGEMEDVSELTVLNTETNESVALILNKEVDSPNQFGEFDYRWNTNPQEKGQVFAVQKLKEFALKTEAAPLMYKLLDGSDAEALIETPKGEKISVKPYPKK